MFDDWPTKEDDIGLAEKIIARHVDMNNGETLSLMHIEVDFNRSPTFCLPEWISELQDFFTERYGAKLGNEVTLKIVANCIIADAVIH